MPISIDESVGADPVISKVARELLGDHPEDWYVDIASDPGAEKVRITLELRSVGFRRRTTVNLVNVDPRAAVEALLQGWLREYLNEFPK